MKRKILFQPARRSFLLKSTSLVAVGILPNGIVQAAPEEQQDLQLYADFEQATLEDALAPQSPYVCTWRTQGSTHELSSLYARNGTQSFRSRMTNPGSIRAEIVGSERAAQIDNKNHLLEMFKTHWYGFSVYIPEPWDDRSTFWELIHQMHGGEPPSSHPNHWPRQPWFGIYVGTANSNAPNHYQLVIRHCPVSYTVSSRSDVRTGYRNETISMLPDVGKWTDWVVQVRPDYRPNNEGGVGFTKVWKDGKLIVDYSGPNFENSDYWPYVKFGLYKRPWGNGTGGDDPVKERAYYYDEIRLSRANVGSYDRVAPRGDSLARPESPIDPVVT
jgi:hypothetical protein